MYDFDKAIDRRGTTSIKWNKQYAFGQKDWLLPFWIADTDFASVPEILDAINELFLDKDAVQYDEHGNATVDFQN